MVCRQLYQFADQGVIQVKRTEIKIEDLLALRNAADIVKGGER